MRIVLVVAGVMLEERGTTGVGAPEKIVRASVDAGAEDFPERPGAWPHGVEALLEGKLAKKQRKLDLSQLRVDRLKESEPEPGPETPVDNKPKAPTEDALRIPEDPEEEREWSFIEWSLLCGLVLMVVLLIVLLCQSSGEKAAVRSVVATLPLTPLCLLIHREFQVVKTVGVVEVDVGDKRQALEQPPLLSPVAGAACVYYHVLVELRTPTGWEIVTDFFDSTGFLLAKDNAQVLIEVEHDTPAIAEFEATAKFEGDFVQLPQPIQAKLQKRPGPKLPAYSMFRVTEWAVREGDEMCAVGLVVRRVRKKVTRTALAPGGLSASNADRVASLFSLVKVGRWQAVGNHVLMTRA